MTVGEAARCAVCRPRAAPPADVSRRGSPLLQQAREQPQKLRLNALKIRRARLGFEVDDQIHGGELPSVLPSPVDLFDPALEPVTDHRDADFPAGGDPDPWVPGLVRNEVEDRQAPMPPTPCAV